MLATRSFSAGLFSVALLVVASAFSSLSYAEELEGLADLVADVDSLEPRLDSVREKFDRLLDKESRTLREQVRTKASYWREDGLLPDDIEVFKRLRLQLRLLHRIQELDFSKIHQKFAVMQRQVAAMEIVHFGKSEQFSNLEKFNVAEQRRELGDSLVAVYLAALASDTPEEGDRKMDDYFGVIQALGEANRDLILDEVEKLNIQEEMLLASIVPIFGDVMALAEAYQGEDVWGKKLGWIDYGLAAISVISVLDDSAALGRFAMNYPEEAAKLTKSFDNARKLAGDLTPAELAVLATLYPLEKLETLLDRNMQGLYARVTKTAGTVQEEAKASSKLASEGLPELRLNRETGQTLDDIVDAENWRGMALARKSIAEQQAAKKVIESLSDAEHTTALGHAYGKLNTTAPSLEIEKLANSWQMTEQDWAKLQRSLKISDSQIADLKATPGALPSFIERETGIPINALQVKVGAVSSGEFITYRKANHEGLRLQKRAVDDTFKGIVTKHKDIKGKSGPGGIIPVDQEFSKLSKELDAADASGDLAEIERIREKIQGQSEGVTAIMQRGIAFASDTLEGRDVIAVQRLIGGKSSRSLVTRDAKTGKFFDIETGRELGKADQVSVVKNTDGNDKKVSILVDRDGKVYVADADPHIWGTRNSDELVDDTRVNGFMTKSEEAAMLAQRRALTAAGLPDLTQHGAQVRAYGLGLPVDETFYVIEANGKIRFINQDELPDLVHYYRLSDVNAPVDPSWNWGEYSSAGFDVTKGASE